MYDLFDGGLDYEVSQDDKNVLREIGFDPRESVLWTGRPQPDLVALKALPTALFGLGLVAFMLFWMTIVVLGKNNGWDRGKVVAPFAPHNVAIAIVAGLWFLPSSLMMLTAPLWMRRQARRTLYVLTGRQAIVLEAGLFGGRSVSSYGPDDLRLMDCDDREDGRGDLVFLNRKTWMGRSEAVGFLAIARVREVEALVRKMLASGTKGGGPVPGRVPGSPSEARTYRVGTSFRFLQAIGLAVGAITGFCLIGNLVVGLVTLVVAGGRLRAELAAFATQIGLPGPLGIIGGFILGLGTLAFLGLITWLAFRTALGTPTEITLIGDGTIELRSWLRTTRLNLADIQSITSTVRGDSSGYQMALRHKGGRVHMVNDFADIRGLLAAIKEANPAVEIRGF